MSNKLTILRCGLSNDYTIDGNAPIEYNGSTLYTLITGETKTLLCENKLCYSDIIIGGKTLTCAGKVMPTNVVVTLTAIVTTYTWKKYNISYEAYETGETKSEKIQNTQFYVAETYTLNSNGSVTMSCSKQIKWTIKGGGNQGEAAGKWVGDIYSSASNQTISQGNEFYRIVDASYWLPKFTINLNVWLTRAIRGGDTGETVSSTEAEAYPINGIQNGFWYVRQ